MTTVTEITEQNQMIKDVAAVLTRLIDDNEVHPLDLLLALEKNKVKLTRYNALAAE